MKLLILDDDETRHKLFTQKYMNHERTHVRTAKVCIKELQENGPWDYVFLDHDLGGRQWVDSNEEETGYQVALWLSENEELQPRKIIIHSFNPIGAGKMKQLLPSSHYAPGIWKDR